MIALKQLKPYYRKVVVSTLNISDKDGTRKHQRYNKPFLPQANQKTLLKLISRVFLCLIPKPNENEVPVITKDSTGLIFRIQIETSDKKLPSNSSRFKGLDIFEYQENKLFKYCTGLFHHDLKAAKNYKIELIEKGFNNAFVVAFLNGERISIEKAIKLAEK